MSQTRSAALVPLPEHRGTTASPRSLAMLCVEMAVVASAKGAESAASRGSSHGLLLVGGSTLLESAVVPVCGSAPLSQLTVLPAVTAPLRTAPSSALPEDSSHGLARGKNLNCNSFVEIFLDRVPLPTLLLLNENLPRLNLY